MNTSGRRQVRGPASAPAFVFLTPFLCGRQEAWVTSGMTDAAHQTLLEARSRAKATGEEFGILQRSRRRTAGTLSVSRLVAARRIARKSSSAVGGHPQDPASCQESRRGHDAPDAAQPASDQRSRTATNREHEWSASCPILKTRSATLHWKCKRGAELEGSGPGWS